MVVETERLRLMPWRSAEWTLLRPLATDPEVMRYITGGAPWNDEATQAFVERQVKLYGERGFCRWKAVEKASGDTIGFCGVGTWRDKADLEIGWWLARQYWGRGLATEAAHAALDDVFERGKLERVVSVAMTGNAASIRIMQKLGLAFECEFESEGVRLVRYALERPRWLAAACNRSCRF